MINIILPAIHFFITLALAMLLIGYFQKSEKNKLSTRHIFQFVLISWFLVQLAGYFARHGKIPVESYPYIMSAYLLVPFLLQYFLLRKNLYQAAIISVVILISAFASGAVVSKFFSFISV